MHRNRVVVHNKHKQEFPNKKPQTQPESHQFQAKSLSEKSNSKPQPNFNSYSQVRTRQDPLNMQDLPADSNCSDQHESQKHRTADFDPSFRNVLQFLKINEQNEVEFRARMLTFGPKDLPFPSQQTLPQTRTSKARCTLTHATTSLKHLLSEFRQKFTQQKKQLQHILNHLLVLFKPMVSSNVESMVNSMYETILNEKVIELPQAKMLQSKVQNNSTKQLYALLEQHKARIHDLELKCEECQSRNQKNQLIIDELEKENRRVSGELKEMVRRLEEGEKKNQNQNQRQLLENTKAQLETTKESLKKKQNEITTLKTELNKQYETIQVLIRNIFDLEQNNKDSNSNVSEKDFEIERLASKLMETESEILKLQMENEKVKSQSYAIYQENFCLLQKIQSFEIQYAEKEKNLRKELQKESKTKIITLELENSRLMNQIAELKQKQNQFNQRNILSNGKTDERKNLISLRRTRFKTTNYENDGIASDDSRQFAALLDSSKETGRFTPKDEVLQNDAKFQSYNSRNSEELLTPKSGCPPRLSLTYKRGNSRQKQITYPNQRQYTTPTQSPYDYNRKITEQYRDFNNDTLFYRPQQQQQQPSSKPIATQPNSNCRPSPRTNATTSTDYYKKQKYIINPSPTTTSPIEPPILRKNSYKQAIDLKTQARSRSKDSKFSQLSNLKLQLNNLTKELKSEMAQIPARRAK